MDGSASVSRLRDLWRPELGAVLPPFFDEPLPAESDATCDHCAMCPPDGVEAAPEHAYYFRSDVKCCSYIPFLPSYVAGALLQDPDPRWDGGLRNMRDRLRRRQGASPLGLQQPRPYALTYEHADAAFGRSRALLCPWYDTERGRCVGWPYRGSVCATYFCKFVHGARGARFWLLLRRYLVTAEEDLAVYAAEALDLDAPRYPEDATEMRGLRSDEVDQELPPPALYERSWGPWAGREEAFFAAAYRMVVDLGAHGYERLGGIRQTALLRQVERAYRKLQDLAIPERLVRNPRLVVYPLEEGRRRLVGYSPSDAVDVGPRLYRLLDRFDGRQPTSVVREAMEREEGIRLADALLVKLVRHEILVESSGQAPR